LGRPSKIRQPSSLPHDAAQQSGIRRRADPAGWALRLFGGTSINLLFLRLDLDADWNVLTGSYGGNVNLRFQL
jgi:hypothetical protein